MSRAEVTGRRVEVRSLGPDDWPTLRDLRLATLTDAPAAFRTTLADLQAWTEHDWRARLAERATFAAYRDGRPRGLVAAHVPETRPDQAELTSMWVSREARGDGVADALVTAVTEWARARALPSVGLWVMTENGTAQRFYARMGFVPTTDFTPDPADPCADQTRMVLKVGLSTVG